MDALGKRRGGRVKNGKDRKQKGEAHGERK